MPSGIFKSSYFSVRSLPDSHERSWKTSFKKKRNFILLSHQQPNILQSSLQLQSPKKTSIISSKINSHQNHYKLYAEDNKKHCLLHSIPQFISFHFFLTFKCPPPSQEHLCHLSIHIYAYQSKISVWGKWMISSLSNKPFHSKIFLSLSLSFLSSSRNCFPPELEWVCAKYQYKSCYLMNVQWQARSTEEN